MGHHGHSTFSTWKVMGVIKALKHWNGVDLMGQHLRLFSKPSFDYSI